MAAPKPSNSSSQKPSNSSSQKPSNRGGQKPNNSSSQKPSNRGGQKPNNSSSQKPGNRGGQKPSNSSSQKSNPTNFENYVTTNRFYIEIEENTVASFSECSGISIDVEKEVYQEGGVNDQQRISLGHTRFSDITLKRGTTDDNTFSQWLSELFEQTTQRRNVNIVTYNQAGDIMKSWCLIGAIPVGWKLPSLEANGNTVAVEELTLAFEGLKISKQSAGGDAVSRDATGYFAESAWEDISSIPPL
ncbi:phage tail protein [Nostoc sp.]|uniref:phage tail protein n=1 Tax=Nostoc sp. TaxID=1180 RepID=UPI002FFBEE5F